MDIQEAADVLTSIIKKTLKAKIYRFGFTDYQGVGDKTASFGLYNSISTTITEETNKIVFRITMVQYGQYVESGRAAGKRMPPVNAIIKWIKSRHLQGRDKKTGKFITHESFAWGIRKNIQKFGIRPNGNPGDTGFIDYAFNQFINDPKLDELLNNWIDKELNLQKIFQ